MSLQRKGNLIAFDKASQYFFNYRPIPTLNQHCPKIPFHHAASGYGQWTLVVAGFVPCHARESPVTHSSKNSTVNKINCLGNDLRSFPPFFRLLRFPTSNISGCGGRRQRKTRNVKNIGISNDFPCFWLLISHSGSLPTLSTCRSEVLKGDFTTKKKGPGEKGNSFMVLTLIWRNWTNIERELC